MEAKEVGRLGVRALPDTSRFREELLAKLKGIEKRARIQIKTSLDTTGLAKEIDRTVKSLEKSARVTLRAVLDDDGLLAGARRASEKAQESARRNPVQVPVVSEMDKAFRSRITGDVRKAVSGVEALIPATVEGERLRSEIAAQVDRIQNQVKAEIPVEPEKAAAFRAKIAKMVSDVEDRAAKIRVDADTAAAAQRLEDLIDDAEDREINIPVRTQAALAAARIAALTRDRLITVHARLSASSAAGLASAIAGLSGLRVLSDLGSSLRDVITNLDRAVPKAYALVPALFSVAAAALAGASNLLALGGSLAAIVPAALALPGILAGFAVGTGVLIAALVDIKDVLGDLGPAFSALQDSISTAYWAQAAQPIRDLANNVLPILQDKLTAISHELGVMAAAIANTLNTPLGRGQLGAQLEYLRESIDIAGEGASYLTTALMTLGTAGASYLPALASWFNQITERFDTFIQTAAGDGSLHRWIRDGIRNLQDLGRVIANTSGILAGLSRAAANAGGASLGALADGLARVNAAINGPVWQGALTTVFEGAHRAIQNMSGGVASLGEAFISFAPTLSDILALSGDAFGKILDGVGRLFSNPALQGGLRDAFTGIRDGLSGLLEGMDPLARIAGSVLEVFGELARAVGPVLATALEGLAPLFETAAEALTPFVEALGTGLSEALQVILPPLSNLAAEILPVLRDVAAEVAPVLAEIASEIGPAMAEIWPQIVETFGQFAKDILPVLGSFLEAMAPVVQTMATEILPAIVDALGEVLPLVADMAQELLPPLADLLGAIVPLIAEFLVPALEFLSDVLSNGVGPALSGIVEILGGVIEGLTGFFDFLHEKFTTNMALFQELPTLIGTALDLVRQAIVEKATEWFVSLATTVSEGITNVVTFFEELPGKVVSAVAGLAGMLVSQGVTWLSGLASSVANGISNVVNFFRELPGKVVSAVAGLAGMLVSQGVTWLSGLASSVANGISRVVGFFRELPGKITGALSGVAGQLVTVGTQMIQGLINGITSMAGAVAEKARSVVQGAIDAAKSALKIKSPSRVFMKIGNYTVAGLVKGLTGSQSKAEKAAGDMAKAIHQQYKKTFPDAKQFQRIVGVSREQGANNFLRNHVNTELGILERYAAQRDKLTDRLKASQKKLDDVLKDRNKYRDSLASTLAGGFSLSAAANGEIGLERITQSAQDALAQIRTLRTQISQLGKLGVPKGLIDEIAQLGGEKGSLVAEQLLKGPRSQLKELSKTYTAIQSESAKTAGTVADQMYGVGVDAARGLVKGIESQLAAVDRASKTLADRLTKKVRTYLGIHSPSRVFMRIGEQTGDGMVMGLDHRVKAVQASMAAMVAPPSPVAPERDGRLGGAGLPPINLTVPAREGEDPSRVGRRAGEALAFELGKWV